jgi:hypothetical protein
MYMENFPGCCTSAVLYSFGEHGEKSYVTVDEINRLLQQELHVRDLGGNMINGHKRCIFAISVDPKNIRILRDAGFKVIDTYEGIQGLVHIMTLHLREQVQEEGLV